MVNPSNIRPATSDDAANLFAKLTAEEIRDPPNVTEEGLRALLESENMIVRVDDDNDTIAGLVMHKGRGQEAPVKEEEDDHIIVIWWLPRAPWAEDNMPQLIPVFGAACEEVVKQYPGSETWAIFGDYPGVGETQSQRRRSSYEMVGEWVVYWNSSPTVGVFAERRMNPYNNKQFRPVGTVGKVIEFAEWVAAQ